MFVGIGAIETLFELSSAVGILANFFSIVFVNQIHALCLYQWEILWNFEQMPGEFWSKSLALTNIYYTPTITKNFNAHAKITQNAYYKVSLTYSRYRFFFIVA